MRHLILVSKTPIVIQIFTLVCKKLNIALEILNEAQIDHKVDIIVIDREFINDRFNILKTYTKQIGAISKNDLPFEMANDFVVPLPFLPSLLQNILEKQLEIIIKKANTKTYISNIEPLNTEKQPVYVDPNNEELDPAVEYLESLADCIAYDMSEESDDSIVPIATLNDGGILDTKELSKIEEIINPLNDITQNISNNFIDEQDDNEEWIDLSSIIDQAIDEINTTDNVYNNYENKPIKLLLNDYSMNELTPLLNLLDQNIIDSLSEGNEISVQLKLGSTNE